MNKDEVVNVLKDMIEGYTGTLADKLNDLIEEIKRDDKVDEQRTCNTCEYRPHYGEKKYNKDYGECRWPCPPCLRTQMKVISKSKPVVNCPTWVRRANHEM